MQRAKRRTEAELVQIFKDILDPTFERRAEILKRHNLLASTYGNYQWRLKKDGYTVPKRYDNGRKDWKAIAEKAKRLLKEKK